LLRGFQRGSGPTLPDAPLRIWRLAHERTSFDSLNHLIIDQVTASPVWLGQHHALDKGDRHVPPVSLLSVVVDGTGFFIRARRARRSLPVVQGIWASLCATLWIGGNLVSTRPRCVRVMTAAIVQSASFVRSFEEKLDHPVDAGSPPSFQREARSRRTLTKPRVKQGRAFRFKLIGWFAAVVFVEWFPRSTLPACSNFAVPIQLRLRGSGEEAGLSGAASAHQETAQLPAVVTAFEVKGAVDYEKLISDFGSQRISPELLARLQQVTGQSPHRLLRRGFFFSHRDLETLLTLYEQVHSAVVLPIGPFLSFRTLTTGNASPPARRERRSTSIQDVVHLQNRCISVI
jgi:hypothetical protein